MSFKEELQAMCSEVPGSRCAWVMSLDGIAVADHQQRSGGVDSESLLIELINPIRQSSEVMGRTATGDLEAIELTAPKGTLLVQMLNEDHFVALLLDPDAVTGRGRYAMRLHRSTLRKELY